MESPTLDVKSQQNSPKGYLYCDWLLVYVLQRYAEYLARAIAPRPKWRRPSALRASPPLAPTSTRPTAGAPLRDIHQDAEGYPSRR